MNITMQKEALTQKLLDEGNEVMKAHWGEVALLQDKIKLDVDMDRCVQGSQSGLMHTYTLRADGKLIGYSSIILSYHLHYKSELFAYVDVIYIDPAYRQDKNATVFMKWIERQMKTLGVSVMTYHFKAEHDHPELFALLGFEKIEHIYAKYLKED